MNPEKPSRDEIEMKLTALLLGELPEDEARLLRWTISQDLELSRLHDQLQRTIGLVRQASTGDVKAVAPAPLKMSDERREKLFAHFKTPRPSESFLVRPMKLPSLVAVLTVVALIAVVAALLLPALSKAKNRAVRARLTVLAGERSAADDQLAVNNTATQHWAWTAGDIHQKAGSINLADSSAQLDVPMIPPAASPPPAPKTEIVLPAAGQMEPSSGTAIPVGTAVAGSEYNFPEEKSIASNSGTLAYDNDKDVTIHAQFKAGPSAFGGFGGGGGAGGGVDRSTDGTYAEGYFQMKLKKDSEPSELPASMPAAPSNRDAFSLNRAPRNVIEGEAVVATNSVPYLGDIPVMGSLATRSASPSTGTTFAQRTDTFAANPLSAQTGLPYSDDKKSYTLPQSDTAIEKEREMAKLALNYPPAAYTPDRSSAAGAVFDGNEQPKASTKIDLADASPNQPAGQERRRLQQLQEVHNLLYSKIKAQEIDSALPKSTEVEIVDTAQPGKSQGFVEKLTGKVQSTARIKVEHSNNVINGFATSVSAPQDYDPYFIQTTFEVIQSELVLGKVVDALHLDQTWASRNGGQKLHKTEALEILKSQLSLKPVPNTKLIAITVTDSDPKESATLANAVAEAYADYRAENAKQQVAAGVVALKTSYQEEDQRIRQLQSNVDQLQTASKEIADDLPLRRPAPDAPIPQPEMLTTVNSFSTFAMNVSDVSFKLAQASLEKGILPPSSSIRSEEFINAFDYRDPEAAPGQPIAFNSERAQDPFAQNRDLLRFSIKTAATGRTPGRPLNLVLLLDNSGSMERADRVAIIRESLRVLATQLAAQDTITVVTFARTAHLWLDGVPGPQAGAALEKAGELTPQGGTNLQEAMRLAYEAAHRHYLANGMNRVVLLTDGAANLGSVDASVLTQTVEQNRQQGIALDCFGIGWEDYNDDLLEQLSSHGDGRYAFLNSPADASSEFAAKLAGALQIAAQDVKVQVEFNPDRVTAWRQIGYAKHQLTKEQFRDNTVAAGEIAAAEAGNALYTVQVKPDGSGPLATVRLRYRVPGTSDYQERSWNVPYTGHAVALEKSSPAMRLATTAAEFSEWLATSPYAQEVTLDQLLNDLNGVPAVYGADARPKNLEWMIRQAKSVVGK